LRHARACYHARGANRAWSNTNLDRVDARIRQFLRSFIRAHIAGDQIGVGVAAFYFADGFEHAQRVSVGSIYNQTIHPGFNEFIGAFAIVSRGSNRGGDAQTSQIVFRRRGILNGLLDIFYGDQALDALVAVDNKELLDPMFLEDRLGLFECGAHGNCDQRLRGHHL
jgi:hypothetical protein